MFYARKMLYYSEIQQIEARSYYNLALIHVKYAADWRRNYHTPRDEQSCQQFCRC